MCHLCCILNKILKFETSTSLHSVFIHNLYSVPTFLESGLYIKTSFLIICIANNFIWTTLKAIFFQYLDFFLHPQIPDCPLVVSRPNIVRS